jgi:hypothetical protein
LLGHLLDFLVALALERVLMITMASTQPMAFSVAFKRPLIAAPTRILTLKLPTRLLLATGTLLRYGVELRTHNSNQSIDQR